MDAPFDLLEHPFRLFENTPLSFLTSFRFSDLSFIDAFALVVDISSDKVNWNAEEKKR